MDNDKILVRLGEMGFKILTIGKDGILAKRDTGKVVGIVFNGDALRIWTRYKFHPFTIYKENPLTFKDELNGDLIKYI